MTESQPSNDFASFPAPAEGILVALFITVRKVARSRDFYSRILGGTVILEENPCTVRLSNSWIIMNPGGPPTPDKPGISVVDYQPGDATSIFLNLRVADIQACYQEWTAKGAEFVTPPIDRGAEIRCYMRDPDGYLIEVGQSTGVLHGHLAAKRPEDLPGCLSPAGQDLTKQPRGSAHGLARPLCRALRATHGRRQQYLTSGQAESDSPMRAGRTISTAPTSERPGRLSGRATAMPRCGATDHR